MFNPFRKKPTPADAARALGKVGRDRDRAKIRATVDDMRARMGMPPAIWPSKETV